MMTWQNHRVEVAGALEGETVVDVETAYNYNILPRLRSDHGPVCAERSDWVGRRVEYLCVYIRESS